MAKKEKFYVVWFGNPAGIFGSWKECQRSIKGVKGAQYMSFPTFADAKIAYNKEYADYKGQGGSKKKTLTAAEKAKYGEPNLYSMHAYCFVLCTLNLYDLSLHFSKFTISCHGFMSFFQRSYIRYKNPTKFNCHSINYIHFHTPHQNFTISNLKFHRFQF